MSMLQLVSPCASLQVVADNKRELHTEQLSGFTAYLYMAILIMQSCLISADVVIIAAM